MATYKEIYDSYKQNLTGYINRVKEDIELLDAVEFLRTNDVSVSDPETIGFYRDGLNQIVNENKDYQSQSSTIINDLGQVDNTEGI